MRRAFPTLFCLGLGTLIGWAGIGLSADPEPAKEKPSDDSPSELRLDLAACRRLALEKQPALAAHRASLAAAESACRALAEGSWLSFLDRDRKIRRQQTCLLVEQAQARLRQAESETIASVTVVYLTALYAAQQESSLQQAYRDLKRIQGFLDQDGVRPANISKGEVQLVASYAKTVEAVLQEAIMSRQRALAALREAIGVGPECVLSLADERLPLPEPTVCREDIVHLALTNRPELRQAELAAELAELEVQAQAAQCRLNAPTFAADSDQHAQPPPQELPLDSYRPAPTGAEMPISLTGFKCARVERARALSAQAAEAVEKTRLRLAREGEEAVSKWREASDRLQPKQDAAEKADEIFNQDAKEFLESVLSRKIKVIDLVNEKVEATQLRGAANQAHFDFVMALVALEKATAGAFCSGLVPAP